MSAPLETYTHLIARLDQNGASYRLIDHAPEGQTKLVSQLRGNRLAQAAKCMVLIVKQGKKTTRYVLAVIPGDARVDFAAIKALYAASYVSFATPAIAEELAGSVAGTILPFADNPGLELIVDPRLMEENEEIFFNAARLDRSLALRTKDYLSLAKPRLEKISLL
jgi:Ala-tRNA(Pro) deacylase